jgi:putative heme-binding domain-containing protein
MGLQVFERNNCTKCHTTATTTTLLAPSLKGIGGQKIDYLIESVLYPSKIIKTGFESETITKKDGSIISGLVKEEGKFFRVLKLDQDIRIAKDDVDTRILSKISVMPEGQEAALSRREFVDLIAYLATLK